MWIYLRAMFSKARTYFVRATLITTALFIVFSLFMRWGFSEKKPTVSFADKSYQQERQLHESFKRPEYQTPSGKQIAMIEKKFYCSFIGSLCTNNPKDSFKNFPKSFIGQVSFLAIAPFTVPPASGIAYIKDSIDNAGLVTKASAAEGIGFASLKGFLPIWRAFRNVTYLILVIAIIVLGFMIMFQFKIDSHTVISVQNSLPRIVIALLVITFSYAIAGLMVDAMYLLILLIFDVFSRTGISGMETQSLQSSYLTSNILNFNFFYENNRSSSHLIYSPLWIYLDTLRNIYILVPIWLKSIIKTILAFAETFIAIRFANNSGELSQKILGDLRITTGVGVDFKAAGPLGILIGALIGYQWAPIIIFLVAVGIALMGILFLYFRIVFLLINSYVQIIITLIFAPFFLLGEAIPGQNSFTSWLRRLIGHLLAFPTVITFMLVIHVIQSVGFDPTQNSFSMPLLYGFNTGVFPTIISGAFLLMIPDLTKTVVKKVAGESSIKASAGLLLGGAGVLSGSLLGSASQLHSLQKITDPTGGLPMLKWIGKKFNGPEEPKSTPHGTKTAE